MEGAIVAPLFLKVGMQVLSAYIVIFTCLYHACFSAWTYTMHAYVILPFWDVGLHYNLEE